MKMKSKINHPKLDEQAHKHVPVCVHLDTNSAPTRMSSPLGKWVEGESIGLLSFFEVKREGKEQGCNFPSSISSKTDTNIQALINPKLCFTILTCGILLQVFAFFYGNITISETS